MSRRAARVAAVEILYGADVRGVAAAEVLRERDEVVGYAAFLVDEVSKRLPELDGLIGRHSIDWRVGRMSPVDRNVLRIAVLELLLGDVPPAVAIDEALEIAKHFSGAEAAKFVNGVLAAVLQDVGGGVGGDSLSGGAGADGGG